jgi:predicted phosphate transport protein (TIGR00153 family)
MVFSTETEQRVKVRALSVSQDHLRKVVEISRKVAQLVDRFVNEDEASVKSLYAEIQALGDEIDEAKRRVARELVEIGAILMNREDFLRFTDLTSEVADFCKGIAFRLLEIMERRWEVPLEVKKGLSKLTDAVFDTVLKLRETLLILNYGSPKVLEKAKNVEMAERNVDDLYRGLEIEILSSKMETPALLLMRDVIQLLEDTADKVEDAADAARILAFSM